MMSFPQTRRITVIGIGGTGNRAIDRVLSEGLADVRFIGIDNEKPMNKNAGSKQMIWLEETNRRGLGPDAGHTEESVMRNIGRITEVLCEADFVILVSAMGGVFGTTASPLIARIVKDQGIPVIGIITMPFYFEQRRIPAAEKGMQNLRPLLDPLIVIHCDSLIAGMDMKKLTIDDAFALSDQALWKSVRSAVDRIMETDG